MAAELLVRAADQGSTYLSWRWVDEPSKANYSVLDVAALGDVLSRLEHALPHVRAGESSRDAIIRSLTQGAFSDNRLESELADSLGRVVLPSKLCGEIVE